MQNWIDCEPGISTSWTNVPGGTMPAGHFDSHPVSAIAHHRSHNLETGWQGLQGMQWQRLPHFVYVCVKDLYRCVSQREREKEREREIISIGLGIVGRTQHAMWSMSIAAGTVSGTGTEQQRQSNKAKQQQQPQPRRRRHRLHQGPIPPQPRWHQEYSVTQLQVCTKTHLGYGQVDQNISEPENGSKKCCILCCAQQLQYIMYKRWDMCISVCI